MQLDRCFSKQTSLLKDSWSCVRAIDLIGTGDDVSAVRLSDSKWQQHMRLDLMLRRTTATKLSQLRDAEPTHDLHRQSIIRY